jgi:ABC-type Fe3+/spermidine/putrescine transport system ATPase subunit
VADFLGVCNFLECRVVARQEGAVLVKIEDGIVVPITVPQGMTTPVEGSRATVAVRPEKVGIEAVRGEHGVILDARVDNVVYVGTAIHFHLRTSAGTSLVAYRQNTKPLTCELSPGVHIRISWDPRDAHLLLD